MLAVLEKLYKDVYVPLPENWNTYDYFRTCLLDLDNTSSPGYPYMRQAPTIGKWLGADGFGKFDEQRVAVLWHDVQQVMANEWEHIFRAFVKDEPHKKAKVIAKRWRLIVASALPVQMVWRMLFKHQNDALNAHPFECPSKHGLVFCYGGWKRFLAMVDSQSLKYSRDIQGWDVNAPGWALRVAGKWRQRWPGITPSWISLQEMMYRDAYRSAKILFSNGLVVEQGYWGFMKSGIFNTISDNSVAVLAAHILACLRSGLIFGHIGVTGDDVIQSTVSDEYLDQLDKVGCRVKELHHHLEFMGTQYFDRVPKPLYFQKHLYSFCMKPNEVDEVLDSYCRMYAHSEYFSFWKSLADDLNVPTRTSAYYKFWYDSPLAEVMKWLW